MLKIVKRAVWAVLFLSFMYQMMKNVQKFSLGLKSMSVSQEPASKHPVIAFYLCSYVNKKQVLKFDGFIAWARQFLFIGNEENA